MAAETVLSDVDGAAGRLIIRGHSLDEIAGRWTFEEAVTLLWSGFFDTLPDDMAAARERMVDNLLRGDLRRLWDES